MLRNMFRFSPKKVLGDILFQASELFLESFSALWLLYKIVDIIENGGAFTEALAWIFGTGAAYAVYFAARKHYECIVKDCADLDAQRGFETLLFDKTAEMDLASFDRPDFYAEYNKAVYCVNTTVFQIFSGIVSMIAFCVMLMNTVVFLCTIEAWLLLFCLFSVATYQLGKQYGRLRAQRQKDVLEHERKQDYVRHIFLDRKYAQELRLSNIKNVLDHAFQHAAKEKEAAIKKHGKRLSHLSFWRTVCSVDGIEIGCYVYAAIRILSDHRMSVAELSVLFSAVIQYASRVRRLIGLLAEAQEKSVMIDSLRNFLKKAPSIQGEKSCGEPLKTLEVRHLSFQYEEGKEILHDINFQINAGEIVMIAGPNGAGKSTLVKLLLRLYSPTHGEILYNGQPIEQFNPAAYRKHFAYMPQDFHIYDMSLEENILMCQSEESVDDNVIRFSGMDKWLGSVSQGLKAHIGRAFDSDGMELSIGQRQNVALARLLTRPYDVYILDEPSSALDPIAESELFRRLRHFARGKTVIFISHRFVSAQYADRVLFLNGEKITESGTHDELMQLGGTYAALFAAQANYYQEDKSCE
ncbi:MAG: ABC transporter ATP-binding protein [Clostridia bacterium]|nr:ABC transporter ATP-binding protein [Clostridia bacterium]